MPEPLFVIQCPTCQARLKVLQESALGTIQACPKCGSMVQIAPPPGWEPPSPAAESVPAASTSAASTAPPLPVVPPPVVPPPVAEAPAAPPPPWWRVQGKWLALAVSLAVVGIGVGLWAAFRSGPPQTPPPVAAQATGTAPAVPAVVVPPERRWLPNQTRLWLSLRPGQLPTLEESSPAPPDWSPLWKESVARLLDGLGLKPQGVTRLVWTATDLDRWTEACVVVLELEKGQDLTHLATLGEATSLALDGHPARQATHGSWPAPFVVLGPQTIVTGQAELLESLRDPAKMKLENEALGRLLETLRPETEAALVVDLPALRQRLGRWPAVVLELWPAGRKAWTVLGEVPQAAGLSAQLGEPNRWELGLACESEAAAQQVQAALEALVPAAQTALETQEPWLAAQRSAERFPAETSDAYEQLVQQTRGQLDAARRELVGTTVWVRSDAPQPLAEWALAFGKSREALGARWRDAALAADRDTQRHVLEALEACRKAEGSYPAGAREKSLLPPETQLSWIGNLLPYLEHADWHKELNSGYAWNSPQNRPITSRPLPEVVNPALGPQSTEDGFPVTHYVGLAGVGPDAGNLKAGDPRAGVFGFSRRTRLEDIPDGASNTIATMGVQAKLGAWASGGQPTVRGLTQRPYVNGPDGFGSGQPDGMLVGMADGSVRFLSSKIDPEVLEQLATAGGHETVNLSLLDPKPATPAAPAAPPAAAVALPTEVPAAEQPAAAETAEAPKPAEPVVLDEARLDDSVAKLAFTDLPLREATELLSQLSTVPISFDLDLLAQLGVGINDPVSVHSQQATIRELLERLAQEKRLGYVVQNGQVLLTAPEAYRTERKETRYPVGDVLAGSTAAVLAERIRRFVAPESWTPSGGAGSLEADGQTLTIQQTPAVSDQVVLFCERLRLARGLSVRDANLAKRVADKPRAVLAQPLLSRSISSTFVQPTPLGRIVADLEQLTGATICIHWIALAAAGVGPDVEATLKANELPLEETLDQLLQPLGLAWRVVDATTLEISSIPALAARRDLEFYPVGDLLARDSTAETLLARVKEVAAGGEASFDPPSKCLLVCQNPRVQRQVAALLERLRAERAAGK